MASSSSLSSSNANSNHSKYSYGALLTNEEKEEAVRLEKLPSADSIVHSERHRRHENSHTGHRGHSASLSSYADFVGAPLMRTLSESVQTLAHSRFALSEEALVDPDRLHHAPAATADATIPSEIANMTKNLIGGGVLSLSGGMALYANYPAAAVPAAAVMVSLLGAVFGYFCLLYVYLYYCSQKIIVSLYYDSYIYIYIYICIVA